MIITFWIKHQKDTNSFSSRVCCWCLLPLATCHLPALFDLKVRSPSTSLLLVEQKTTTPYNIHILYIQHLQIFGSPSYISQNCILHGLLIPYCYVDVKTELRNPWKRGLAWHVTWWTSSVATTWISWQILPSRKAAIRKCLVFLVEMWG